MTVRASCGVAKHIATSELIGNIRALGITPIVTNYVIRAVYEGPDKALGQQIVELFRQEDVADIYYDFGERGRKK